MLFIFEDNEAVIKMIIKGRSPTLRHVSKTHRDAFAWLFNRINLDPKIQIRYVDSKNQQADIFDQRTSPTSSMEPLSVSVQHKLFQLSKLLRSQLSNRNCSEANAKRPQKGDYDERVVAK